MNNFSLKDSPYCIKKTAVMHSRDKNTVINHTEISASVPGTVLPRDFYSYLFDFLDLWGISKGAVFVPNVW